MLPVPVDPDRMKPTPQEQATKTKKKTQNNNKKVRAKYLHPTYGPNMFHYVSSRSCGVSGVAHPSRPVPP